MSRKPMYELVYPEPEVTGSGGDGPVLIHALEGFADAGHAVRLTASHLIDSLDARLVATFDLDELFDYRSRRPPMTVRDNAFVSAAMPALRLHALTDAAGRGFLLLSGSEPDLRWETFAHAVTALAEQFGVSTVVGINAIGMSVPHTRRPPVTAHGHAEIIAGLPTWDQDMTIPGSASLLLELRLGERGYRTGGLTVHVPHYLSNSPYPLAAERLVETVNSVAGLRISTAALQESAATIRTQIDAEVADNPEVGKIVTALEEQYDSFTRARDSSLLASEQGLPSGEELGAELEAFLRSRAEGDG